MPESYVVFATLLGGLGLFLVAMEMMTDGLTLAAGQSLRRLLANWTNTLVRGVLSVLLTPNLLKCVKHWVLSTAQILAPL